MNLHNKPVGGMKIKAGRLTTILKWSVLLLTGAFRLFALSPAVFSKKPTPLSGKALSFEKSRPEGNRVSFNCRVLTFGADADYRGVEPDNVVDYTHCIKSSSGNPLGLFKAAAICLLENQVFTDSVNNSRQCLFPALRFGLSGLAGPSVIGQPFIGQPISPLGQPIRVGRLNVGDFSSPVLEFNMDEITLSGSIARSAEINARFTDLVLEDWVFSIPSVDIYGFMATGETRIYLEASDLPENAILSEKIPITSTMSKEDFWENMKPTVVLDEQTGNFQVLGLVHMMNELAGDHAMLYSMAFSGHIDEISNQLTIRSIQFIASNSEDIFLEEVVPGAARQFVSALPLSAFKKPAQKKRAKLLKSIDEFQAIVREKLEADKVYRERLWNEMGLTRADSREYSPKVQEYDKKVLAHPKGRWTLAHHFDRLVSRRVDGLLGPASDDWISKDLPADERARILLAMALMRFQYSPH